MVPCKCSLNGYAGSPDIHNWLHLQNVRTASIHQVGWTVLMDCLNIAASYFLTLMGPKRFPINPFGVTTDWNLIAWALLCLLNKSLWNLPGLHIFTKVPSTKPHQFCKGAPELWIVWHTCSREFGDSQGCFNVPYLQLWWLNVWLETHVDITHNSWTEHPNLGIISLNQYGYEYRLR